MDLRRRSVIIGIVILAAIALVVSSHYVVHMPEPSAANLGAPSSVDALLTSTSQHSLQQATGNTDTPACTTDVPGPTEVPPVTAKWISIHDPSLKYYLDYSRYTLQNGTICELDSGNTSFNIPLAADAASFVISTIDLADAKDKNNVYCNGQVLTGADPATFEVLSGSLLNDGSYERSFAKDKNHAYVDCAVITDADAATFRLVGNPNVHDVYFSKDAGRVYFCGGDCNPPIGENNFEEIAGADPSTFELVSNYIVAPGSQGSTPPSFYAQDINHVYQGTEIMTGANPKTTALYCYDNSPDVGSTPYPLYCAPK
jgi:hypothetical protein